jgi:hypothetical protein
MCRAGTGLQDGSMDETHTAQEPSMESTIYLSFLIRMWTEQSKSPADADWQGEVEHIQSGACWRFDTLSAVLRFLQHAVEEPNTVRPGADTQPSD